MAELVPGKYEGSKMNRFSKGESGNPKGRPRKLITKMKIDGYKLSEINDTIQAMVSMKLSELKTVWDNPDSTILEKTVANALRKSLEKGELDSVETLLNRVYGKPKEHLDIEQKNINININLEK